MAKPGFTSAMEMTFAQAVRLKPDMITLEGDPIEIPLKNFREGIVVFKRAGKYYFMWSIDDARSPDYRVGYGIADSPTGPVHSPEKNFIVLQRTGRQWLRPIIVW